jgi:ubiquinone/menaquinone biosynthesis C-methylase UbiE
MSFVDKTSHLARGSRRNRDFRSIASSNQSGQHSPILGKLVHWLGPVTSKAKIDWTIEQLHLSRYQHILEVGCVAGDTLHAVARQLKVGFVAGVEESFEKFQQAHKTNKKFIGQGLMQLHPTSSIELPYPSQYFHTVYSTRIELFEGQPQYLLERLVRMLKSGGRLVLAFALPSSVTQLEINAAADRMIAAFIEAGLINIHAKRRAILPLHFMAIVGYKE